MLDPGRYLEIVHKFLELLRLDLYILIHQNLCTRYSRFKTTRTQRENSYARDSHHWETRQAA